MSRRGFTLIELLVATIVFLIGFVAVFSLFLGGMRFRKLAEDTTRASLAASCILDEIRIDAGGQGLSTPRMPKEYVGDGFAPFNAGTNADQEGTDTSSTAEEQLFPYKPLPGIWYRVMKATDLNETQDPKTTAINLELVVVPFASADDTLSFKDLNKRLNVLGQPYSQGAPAVADELVKRGIAFRYRAVITRRASWLP